MTEMAQILAKTGRRLPASARRDHLLDVAAAVLLEGGFEALTMEAVKERAGVSRGLAYVHFANADELAFALYEREVAELDRRIAEVKKVEGTFEDRVRLAMKIYFDFAKERGGVLSILQIKLTGRWSYTKALEMLDRRFKLWSGRDRARARAARERRGSARARRADGGRILRDRVEDEEARAPRGRGDGSRLRARRRPRRGLRAPRGPEILTAMKAATIRAHGGPEVLRVEEVPAPRVGPRDVLVAVRAAGVNPVDCKMRAGAQRALMRRKMPMVLGLDVSGVVLDVGAKVTKFSRGDEVFGSPTHARDGTHAELVAVDEAELARKPARITHVEAASLPLVAQTVWQCLVTKARLVRGERVFVQAGAGGVGTFAIQLAKHLGAEVATTASTGNVEFLKRLGADVVVDRTRARFEEELSGYDVALESIGGADLARARRVLRPGGRLVYITSGIVRRVERFGPYLGAAATVFDMASFALSTRLRGRRASFVVRRPDGAGLAQVADLVDRGVIRPIVERTFSLERIADAHRAMESGKTRGKIVVDLTASS